VVEGFTADRVVLLQSPAPKRQIEDLRLLPSLARIALGLSPGQQSRLTRFHDDASLSRLLNQAIQALS
jgi:hypothetical protein